MFNDQHRCDVRNHTTMNHHKRQSLHHLSALGIMFATWPQASANTPSRVIVPFNRGGISSHVADALGKELTKLGKHNWVTDHIPGYSNMSAVHSMIKAGDKGQWDIMIAGPTLLTTGNSMSPFTSINVDRDIRALTGLIQGPMILISHVKSDLNHWRTIELSKRRLRVGVSGLGSASHFVAAHMDHSGLPLGDAYNTEGDQRSMQRLAKGELDLAVISIGSCLPPVNKDYNALLTSGSQPMAWRDNITIPTMASAGQTPEARAFHFYSWLAVCVSAKMPPAMQQAITESIQHIKNAGGLTAVANTTYHQVMHSAPSALLQQIHQSRALLEQYILSAKLANTLGLELTR